MHRVRRIVVLLAVIGGGLMLPGAATSAQDYDLDFTLPTAGKSGCMVCHGDPNLVRNVAGGLRSYWVDGEILDASAHASIYCVGCHTDFAFGAPHGADAADWRRTAKLACKNCHQEQFEAYSQGVHSISVKPGEIPDAERNGSAPTTPSAAATRSVTATRPPSPGEASGEEAEPLCGDCHGAHDIDVLTDNPAGRLRMHRRGAEVCGRCHEDHWESYNDYYHGRPYKEGVWDAPSCWQCHGWHDVRPVDDRRSTLHESKVVETCGACHRDSSEAFVDSTVGMIHGRDRVLDANVVYAVFADVRIAVTGLADRVASVFR